MTPAAAAAAVALSLRSGAVGLTLTTASYCYLLEPSLNEGTELQVRVPATIIVDPPCLPRG